MIKPSFLALALVTLAGAAQAAEPVSPFYVSAALGRVHGDTFCVAGNSCDHTANFGKFTAGYDLGTGSLWPGSQITSSVELSHFLTGTIRHSFAPGAANRTDETNRATGLYYKASVRESDAFSLNARIGYAHLVRSYDNTYAGKVKVGSNTFAGGLGLSYALDKNWSLNADIDYLHSSKLKMISVGAGYRF